MALRRQTLGARIRHSPGGEAARHVVRRRGSLMIGAPRHLGRAVNDGSIERRDSPPPLMRELGAARPTGTGGGRTFIQTSQAGSRAPRRGLVARGRFQPARERGRKR